MRFYDRQDEMAQLRALSKAADRKAVICVITGVRRVGKTELVKEFFKKDDGLYFFADNSKTSSQHLSEFSEKLRQRTGSSERMATRTWDDFFNDLFEAGKRQKLIVAFDEFQRFSTIDRGVPFSLQQHFDLHRADSKLLILLSGSSFGMLMRMFIGQDAPLFQRPSNTIHLRQFDFQTVCTVLEDLGVKSFADKVELYALFGGIPKYYDLLEDYSVANADDALEKMVFNTQAPLRDEVKSVIMEEFGKETATYYGILCAAAFGKTKANEIADCAGIKATSLAPYLFDLTELLGALKKELPVTEDIKSKKARYYLDNNFFKTWFRFIHKNRAEIELGRFDGLLQQFKREKEAFTGPAFESVCCQYLAKTASFDRLGKWWGKERKNTAGNEVSSLKENRFSSKSYAKTPRSEANSKPEETGAKAGNSIEIDLVGLDEKNSTATFSECKWQEKPPSIADLERLRQKARSVNWKNGVRVEKFVIFSKTPFGSKTTEYAKHSNFTLVSLKELERGMTE